MGFLVTFAIVVIFQLHLHMVYIHVYRSVFDLQELARNTISFFLRGSLFANKLMSQGFQLSRLQAVFRKFYGRYNDLISPYNLSLGHMLYDMFHTNR
jgi:hypothetical protein